MIQAAVGNGAVGPAQLQRGYPIGKASQRKGQSGVLLVEGQTHVPGKGLAAVYAQLGKEGDGRDIQGTGHGLPHGHPAGIAAAGVGGGILPIFRLLVQQHGGGGVPGLQRRRIDQQRLYDRPGLTADIHRPVQSQRHLLIPAPYQRGNAPRGGFYNADGPLRAFSVLPGEVFVPAEGFFAKGLQGTVHGRVDLVAPFQQLRHGYAQDPAALLQGIVYIVAPAAQRRVFGKQQGLPLGGFGLGIGNKSVLGHKIQYDAPPAHRGFRPQMGGKAGGGFEHSCQQRRLRKGKIPGGYAEIASGGGLQPVIAPAEVNRIQIHGQDLILGIFPLQLDGKDGFVYLAAHDLLCAQVGALDKLLGNGAGSLHIGAGQQILPGGPADADQVNAPVGIKAGVFGGDKGIFYMFRQRFPYEQPVFLIIQAGDKGALFIVNAQGELVLRELFRIQHPPGRACENKPGQSRCPQQKDPAQDQKYAPQQAALFGHVLFCAMLSHTG